MDADDLDPDPIVSLRRWKAEAGTDAACLATAGSDGLPDARMVLVKAIEPNGISFFTNRDSAKGRQLAENPNAALVFYWQGDRQIRVRGPVEQLDDAASDAYWASRPLGSRLGAWASEQSTVIDDRATLERRLAEVQERFGAGDVPRPEFWGGYVVRPALIEFWHHRDDRLHDRIRYRRDRGAWVRERLSP
ncbi:MAG TPA: pyridoxamine 5'-phosphate oxidase [Acidimicrobiales bacterium]|nr:pyridoxamine 5'-phosphate oxidase [Acidimicrobiales bacterium]